MQRVRSFKTTNILPWAYLGGDKALFGPTLVEQHPFFKLTSEKCLRFLVFGILHFVFLLLLSCPGGPSGPSGSARRLVGPGCFSCPEDLFLPLSYSCLKESIIFRKKFLKPLLFFPFFEGFRCSVHCKLYNVLKFQ